MCVGVVDRVHAGVATDGAELWLIGTCVCVGAVDRAHAWCRTVVDWRMYVYRCS